MNSDVLPKDIAEDGSLLAAFTTMLRLGGEATAAQVKVVLNGLPLLLKHLREAQEQEARLTEEQIKGYVEILSVDADVHKNNMNNFTTIINGSMDKEERDKLIELMRVFGVAWEGNNDKTREKMEAAADRSRESKNSIWKKVGTVFIVCIAVVGAGTAGYTIAKK